MKPKSMILLGVSGAFGLIAAALLTNAAGQPGSGAQMKGILIASEDMDIGTLLSPENSRIEQWPENIIPPGVVEAMEEATDKRVNVRLAKGAPVFQRDLVDKHAPQMLPIPEGKSVVGLKVPAEDHIAGLLQPGHIVDVIGVFDLKNKPFSRTFLHGLRVYSVSNRLSPDAVGETKSNESDITVSLIVSEKEAESLTLVSRVAKVKLAIRGVGDIRTRGTKRQPEESDGPVSLEALMGLLPNEPTAAAAVPQVSAPVDSSKPFRMQVFSGNFYYEYEIKDGKFPQLVSGDSSDSVTATAVVLEGGAISEGQEDGGYFEGINETPQY